MDKIKIGCLIIIALAIISAIFFHVPLIHHTLVGVDTTFPYDKAYTAAEYLSYSKEDLQRARVNGWEYIEYSLTFAPSIKWTK